jgi:hypothetical protein
MPIDLAIVDWIYVGVLAVLAFFASLVGNLLFFNYRVRAALLSAVLFAGLFVAWTYYPHGLPLPTSLAVQQGPAVKPAPVTPSPIAPVTPPAPVKPNNPVMDITPPATPAR